MSFLIDVIFVSIIVLFAVISSKRYGIADEIPKTASVLFASVSAVKFSSFLSVFTFNTFFKDSIAQKILPVTEKIFYMEGQTSNADRIMFAMPNSISNGAKWLVFNDKLSAAKLDSYVYHPADMAADEISSLVAGPVLTSLFKGIYILLGFFVFLNLFKLIFSSLKSGLNSLTYNDSVICGCIGAVRGFIYVLIISGIIYLVFPIFNFYGKFLSFADNSFIFRIIFNENIFVLS